jgi:hypothetical protein
MRPLHFALSLHHLRYVVDTVATVYAERLERVVASVTRAPGSTCTMPTGMGAQVDPACPDPARPHGSPVA